MSNMDGLSVEELKAFEEEKAERVSAKLKELCGKGGAAFITPPIIGQIFDDVEEEMRAEREKIDRLLFDYPEPIIPLDEWLYD